MPRHGHLPLYRMPSLLAALLIFFPVSVAVAQPLQVLSDTDMADVSGREGIAMNIGWHINATLSGSTVTKVPCSVPTTECRLGLSFADRPGIWLVMKDYYGIIALNAVWIDAATSPATNSVHYDASRFPVGYSPNNKPMIQLSYDHSSLGASQAYYGDALYYLHAGRVTAEFDSGGTPGYLRNSVTGAPLSLRAADGPNGINGPAQIRFDGKMQMYGFGF